VSAAWTIFTVIYILAAGFLFTHKLLPFLVTKAGRAMGFKMEMSPIWAKRIARFKRIKRGYYAFRIITTLFVLSFFLELMLNNRPIAIHYQGKTAFPAVKEWLHSVLFFTDVTYFQKKSEWGQIGESEVDYRRFKRYSRDPDDYADIAEMRKEIEGKPAPRKEDSYYQWEKYQKTKEKIEQHEALYETFKDGSAWCVMPLYPYSWSEHLLDLPDRPPTSPDWQHPLGTDDSGLDVLPQLAYGFRISLLFALLVAAIGYSIGVIVGGVMGYYGGWTDILVQRFIEIWSSVPFLFTIMIIASIIQPQFLHLVILLIILRGWIGITYTIRGEFYREKARDYVQAAIAMGQGDWKVMTRHILPNALVPIVTFAPFGIVAYIGSLVSLDYLGFGLPVGTPSWGGLLNQGMKHVLHYPHLILITAGSFSATLFCVVMIGEAVREAFDPKVFSRLR